MEKELWKLNDTFKYRGDIYIARPCTMCAKQNAIIPCDYTEPLCLFAVRSESQYPECMFRNKDFDIKELEKVPAEDLSKYIIEQL